MVKVSGKNLFISILTKWIKSSSWVIISIRIGVILTSMTSMPFSKT